MTAKHGPASKGISLDNAFPSISLPVIYLVLPQSNFPAPAIV